MMRQQISRSRRIVSTTILLLTVLAAAGALFSPGTTPVQAQEILPTNTWIPRPPTRTPTVAPLLPMWSIPIRIFASRGELHNPFLVADDIGRIHLFWLIQIPTRMDGSQGYDVIYYSQRTETGWTNPVDIQVSTNVYNPVAVVDHSGMIHLFWSGENFRLNYTRAHVDEASQASRWSKPQAFDWLNFTPHVAVDNQNNLHVVYPGDRDRGVYYMRSNDGGDRWSAPVNIHPSDQLNTSAESPRIVISPASVLHVVWTEYQFPSGWPPTGIFYARSEDGGQTWSDRVQITANGYDQANIAIVGEDEIHIVWNAMVSIAGRYHRWSPDGGKRWSRTNEISPLGGTEGQPQIVVDSIGSVHVLTTYEGCAYHHIWSSGHWSEGQCLIPETSRIENLAITGLVEEPALAITRGNRLHAVFFNDRINLWYSEVELLTSLLRDDHSFQPRPTETQVFTATPRAGTPLPTTTQIPPEIYEGEIQNPHPLDSLARDLAPSFLVLCLGAGAVFLIRAQHRRPS